MSLKIVQLGRGSTRDVALMYLVGAKAKDLAAELGPDVCVVAETASKYNVLGAGGVTPWNDAIAEAQAQDPFDVGRIWLIGFSAGTQGVRTQLNIGCPAQYILACDGIHMPLGNPTAEQKDSWLRASQQARSGGLVFSVSCSKTAAYDFKTTRQSIIDLFAVDPCFGSPSSPCVEQDGLFRVYGATTPTIAQDPKGEHMAQLHEVLPVMIRDARSGASGSSGDGWLCLLAIASGITIGYVLAD